MKPLSMDMNCARTSAPSVDWRVNRLQHNRRQWKSPAEAGLFVSRPVSRILSRVTIPLGSYPGPRRATWSRALFALHRTGFGKPSRRRDAGGLLPHRFTLTGGISGDTPSAVSFLFHFPSAFAASLAGASCPSVSGLSSTPSREPRSPGLHFEFYPVFQQILVAELRAAFGAEDGAVPGMHDELAADEALERDAAQQGDELLIERPCKGERGHAAPRAP